MKKLGKFRADHYRMVPEDACHAVRWGSLGAHPKWREKPGQAKHERKTYAHLQTRQKRRFRLCECPSH
jgi:hypothetical protein